MPKWALGIISWAAGCAIWEIVGHITSRFVFAPFSTTVVALWHLLFTATFWTNFQITMTELLFGFVGAAVMAIPGGLIAGLSRTFRELTERWVVLGMAVPFAAVFPMMIVWFGLGETSKIALAWFAAFMPIWLNIQTGVRSVDPALIEMARAFRLSTFRIVKWVVLPWTLPMLIDGLRIGLTRAFLGVVVGELLASSGGGLGYFIGLEGNLLRMDNLLAAVIVVTGVTLALSYCMKLVQRWVVPWWEEREA